MQYVPSGYLLAVPPLFVVRSVRQPVAQDPGPVDPLVAVLSHRLPEHFQEFGFNFLLPVEPDELVGAERHLGEGGQGLYRPGHGGRSGSWEGSRTG